MVALFLGFLDHWDSAVSDLWCHRSIKRAAVCRKNRQPLFALARPCGQELEKLAVVCSYLKNTSPERHT